MCELGIDCSIDRPSRWPDSKQYISSARRLLSGCTSKLASEWSRYPARRASHCPTSPCLLSASPAIKPDWHSQSIKPAAWWTMDVTARGILSAVECQASILMQVDVNGERPKLLLSSSPAVASINLSEVGSPVQCKCRFPSRR
jgi:hypothetical protein